MIKREEAVVGTGRRPAGSKVGHGRVMTTWAIEEAWEEFCTKRREVIIHSFTAVGLSLPIDGSHDRNQLSLKGVDMERFTEDIQNWRVGGIENTGDEDDEEITPEAEDNSEAIDYVVGPLRTEE
ncbi:hypothetical protein HOY82DRAFT_538549 [Tuber indicum]|nr:hypothetical protein HOY82DRAFT_538549 [Tuber indicum]